MLKLKDTVKSFMTKEVYGAAGEPVLIIVERGNVVIVESLKGDRFPTLKANLTEENVEVKPSVETPVVPEKKTKPVKSNTQSTNTLF